LLTGSDDNDKDDAEEEVVEVGVDETIWSGVGAGEFFVCCISDVVRGWWSPMEVAEGEETEEDE